ncbi:MAG: hypothetical protein J6Q13_00065 [Clostridia bacterium]|nr:hypothetical protein [Clostridia bacterium]
MKIKTINKSLLIILMLCTMIISVFAFAGCKDKTEEEFKPIELTAEQAQTAFDNAITNANAVTNIYVQYSENEYMYADVDCCYEKVFLDVVEFDDRWQEQWLVYEDNKWVAYECEKNVNTQEITDTLTYDREDIVASNYIEACVYSTIGGIIDEFPNATMSAIQTAENVVKFTLKEIDVDHGDEYLLDLQIVDGYITKINYIYKSEDVEVQAQNVTIQYNVADKEIPELPDLEWN